MSRRITIGATAVAFATLLAGGSAGIGRAQAAPQQSAPQAASRVVGAITAIQGNTLTVKTDAGSEITVLVDDSTRLLRAAPGQKDLSSAPPIQVGDLAVGDRILARTAPSADSGSVTAKVLVAMKQSDIASKQQKEQEDWQRRGIAGLVKSVDPASGDIVVSVGMTGARTITLHTTSATVLRRYAAGSVKFDDTKPAPISAVHPGDQLRARGDRGADGSTFAAEEIVSGSFHNIAATVLNADAAAGTLTLKDLATKKPVTVRVTADSQLRRLPPAMAQAIAARFKSGGQGGNGAAAGAAPTAAPAGDRARSGGGDPQQALSRVPQIALSDLKKDDAVMVVSTEGSAAEAPLAVTLLAGVEPLLEASPSASQNLMAAWNPGGGADAVPQ